MKAKIAILVLVLFCVGLGIGLVSIQNKATEEKQKDVANIVNLSNNVVQTQKKLDEEKTVTLTLETNLVQRKSEIENLSNDLASTKTSLTKAQQDAKLAAAEILKRDAEIAKRDVEIAKLQGDVDEKTQKMLDLNSSLDKLEKEIQSTQKKLAASEGDKDYLLKELKRLQAEKAELERQFNDLAVLREQVSRLKDELSIARRLDWIRRGIYGNQTMKGGELLNTGIATAVAKPAANNSSLNVEIKQDGNTKILPATNAPAQK
ncbi:MAG: hypothetical protein H7X97_04235 [Opitutaceae bacterium]|nr:hypothetical protein [Verrucomicrobiales bacterium]